MNLFFQLSIVSDILVYLEECSRLRIPLLCSVFARLGAVRHEHASHRGNLEPNNFDFYSPFWIPVEDMIVYCGLRKTSQAR